MELNQAALAELERLWAKRAEPYWYCPRCLDRREHEKDLCQRCKCGYVLWADGQMARENEKFRVWLAIPALIAQARRALPKE